MSIFALRIFIFFVLPLLLAASVIGFDRSVNSRLRRAETFLIFLFALGVAGSGIGNFFAHFFISDLVAESIGWETGSPFQLEIAFSNLSIGLLGIVAVSRRDGFREATVIAVTVFSFGATIVHLMDIIATGNLAPGNSLQNVLNILRPLALIGFLIMSRRAEAESSAELQDGSFERWRVPFLQSAGPVTALVSTAFGAGFALNMATLFTVIGALLGMVIVFLFLRRSELHPLRGFLS